MTCETCRDWLGAVRSHGAGVECPVRASTWCSQCGCYGHRPRECEVGVSWTRPATLEELIPPEIRARWGITTRTPIVWGGAPASVEEAEREISDLNVIEIRFHRGVGKESRLDARLREFMRMNGLETTHSCVANEAKLRRWAISQGKKIRLVPE